MSNHYFQLVVDLLSTNNIITSILEKSRILVIQFFIMKTVIISDLHGKDVWKDILEKESPDKVVFVGDYFDSFEFKVINNNYTASEKLARKMFNKNLANKHVENFKEILKLENATFLIGNHDYHYSNFNKHPYSGYQLYYDIYENLTKIIDNLINTGKLQLTTVVDDFLISHAGVSKEFCMRANIEYSDINTLSENLNNAFTKNPYMIEFGYYRLNDLSYMDESGDNNYQSPIWIRPTSLYQNSVPFNQIVGHTRQSELKISEYRNTKFLFTDILNKRPIYPVIENGVISFNILWW
jgi:hypothetical protein